MPYLTSTGCGFEGPQYCATTAEEFTMDRCPNCGATVRVGAKFCTTCGMRLPEPAATASTNEETSRSPFDSTSTVASRWPARSVYAPAEPGSTEAPAEAAAPASDELTEAPAEPEATASPEFAEPVSTWGAWSPPPPPAVETEEPAAASDAAEPAAWGASEPATEEPPAEEFQSSATEVEAEPADEVVSSTWGRSGETDFLQLPEQPDPAAWKSIESELAGSAESEVPAEIDTDAVVEEIAIDEVIAEEVEAEEEAAEGASAGTSNSIARAYVLLDELRLILAGMTLPAAPAEAEHAPSPPPDFEGARPSDDALARFAELRAAVDTAQEHPRDIDTMLDLSGRLDVIIELHDAFNSLHAAAFGGSESESDEDSGEE